MDSISFKAIIDGQTKMELREEQIKEFDLIELSDKKFHILYGDKTFQPELISKEFSKRHYSFRLGSSTYQVKIKDELDDMIETMGFTLGASKISNSVHAPMPGILLEIKVKIGDVIKKGDTLLILEAMKMENAILSPKEGVVKDILAKPGDTVDKNKLLVELE